MSQTENTVTDAPTMEKSVNEEIHEQFIEVVQTLSTFKSTITLLSSQIKILERNMKKH